MNNELCFSCFVLYIIPAFIYCDRVFISSDLGMEEAGVNGSLGLLDTQDMWQGVAGDKQEAVQGVHTYTLPPEQEVALLKAEGTKLRDENSRLAADKHKLEKARAARESLLHRKIIFLKPWETLKKC